MAMVINESKKNFAPQLCKTRMCKFFEQGNCSKGDKCNFAHTLTDLQSRPNLHKTQLCMAFQRTGVCRDGPACKYAHGERELQPNTKQAFVSGSTSNVQVVPLPAIQAMILLQPVQIIGVFAQCSNIDPSKDEGTMKHQKEDDICSVLTTDEDLDLDLESLDSSSRQTSAWSSFSEEDLNDSSAAESDSSSQCQFSTDVGSEAVDEIRADFDQEVQPKNASLHKTKMCTFFMQGYCRKGSMCKFAHESTALKARPNLFRTSLCMAFERSGRCKMGDNCKYAHGTDQLQKSSNDSGDFEASETHSLVTSHAAEAENMFKSSRQTSNFLTHEASGVVVSTKNTFIHLRSQVRETRRRSASC
jgi:hypothetical protein